MTIAEDILAIKDEIRNEDHWCQDSISEPSFVPIEEADKVCLMGAVYKIRRIGSHQHIDVFRFLQQIMGKHYHMTIPTFNDTHTHQEVLDFLDFAVCEAKDQGI